MYDAPGGFATLCCAEATTGVSSIAMAMQSLKRAYCSTFRVGSVLVCFLSIALPCAQARTVEPGEVRLSAGIGPTVRMPSLLGPVGGEAYFNIFAGAAYAIDRALSLVGQVQLGGGRAAPLRFHLGGQYRFVGLDFPVTPYVQGHLLVGAIFGVLGADLPVIGAGAVVGADYDLTAKFAVGAALGSDFSTTISERSTFYGVVDVLLYASLAI